jgi:hypothetical protein
MTILPLELIELIIDHLEDDQDALRNSCLTNRQFVHPCRKYLFYTLPSFEGSTKLIVGGQFLPFRICTEGPASAQEGRLHICPPSHSSETRRFGLRFNVQMVSTFWRPAVFPPSFVKKNRIESLHLSRIKSAPISFLYHFTSLRSLTTSRVTFVDEGDHIVDTSSSIHLTRLEMEGFGRSLALGEALILVSKALSLSQLTHLSMRISITEIYEVPAYLELPKRLQYLKLDLSSTLICCNFP